MKKVWLFPILMIGLALIFLSKDAFAVKTPIVFPEDNALFYIGNSDEAVVSAQGWASITKGIDNRLEIAVTVSGLVRDCVYSVRLIDSTIGKKEDLGLLLTDEEGKGSLTTLVSDDYLRNWNLIEVYEGPSCSSSGSREKRVFSFNLEAGEERG